MRLYKLLILILVCCLTGCSLDGEAQETIGSFTGETYPVVTEPVATNPTEVPTEVPSQPPETVPPETEPVPEAVQPEPEDGDFVKVQTYIPDMVVDLRYATDRNFTGQRIYDFEDVWLRYGTVKKLMLVQEELREQGLGLKIWDGFRPPSAQFKLWDVCPDPTYVSDPNNGFSSHSRGNTVDVALVDANGVELVMPTGFDDFSKLADRDYSDCGDEAAANALLLEEVMKKYGFRPYSGEWWHFTDTEDYPVEQEMEPVMPEVYYADCNEFISLRAKPSTSGDVITRIPAGDQFRVVALWGDFALVEYLDLRGYVLRGYIQPAV